MFALRRSRPTVFRTMDIYNPFVNQDQATDTFPGHDAGNDFQVVNLYLDQVNSYIASTSVTYQFAYAPVHLWFNGPRGTTDPSHLGLLAFDDFHPSAKGHALIGQLLDGLGYVPIMP
jgi:lysophospholipase L1-like esterase